MLNEVSIEIIRRCACNCVHCSSLSDDKCPEILEYDVFADAVKSVAELGAKTICLSGGEPFMHPQIVDMIEYINSLGLETYVYTSGIIPDAQNRKVPIPKETLQVIADIVTKLIFNVEAATSESYDSIMGTKDCFEVMKQSITSASCANIVTEAHFVPMKPNIDEIEATVELCKELGISKLSFLRLVLHGRALENKNQLALSNEELALVKALLAKIQTSADIDIRIGIPLSAASSCHKCEAANGKLNIRYDGKVYPCEVFKNEVPSELNELQPENIYSCSLEDIYHNSQYLCAVRELSKNFSDTDNETCVGQFLIGKD